MAKQIDKALDDQPEQVAIAPANTPTRKKRSLTLDSERAELAAMISAELAHAGMPEQFRERLARLAAVEGVKIVAAFTQYLDSYCTECEPVLAKFRERLAGWLSRVNIEQFGRMPSYTLYRAAVVYLESRWKISESQMPEAVTRYLAHPMSAHAWDHGFKEVPDPKDAKADAKLLDIAHLWRELA